MNSAPTPTIPTHGAELADFYISRPILQMLAERRQVDETEERLSEAEETDVQAALSEYLAGEAKPLEPGWRLVDLLSEG